MLKVARGGRTFYSKVLKGVEGVRGGRTFYSKVLKGVEGVRGCRIVFQFEKFIFCLKCVGG